MILNKLFPMSLLAWVTVVYLLIIGAHDWRLWIPLAFIFFERMFFAIAILVVMRVQRRAQKAVADIIDQAIKQTQGGQGGFGAF